MRRSRKRGGGSGVREGREGERGGRKGQVSSMYICT